MNSNENFDQDHHQKVVEEGNGKYVDLLGTLKENLHPHHPTSSNVCYQLNDEQFDKLVLAKFTSASSSSNQFSNLFADPHPLAIVSFIITLTPTCAAFMYWGDANPNSLIGLVGQFFFTGGLGLWIAGLMAYVQGSTFAMIVYTMYGSFWLGLGFLDLPAQGLTTAIGGPTSPVFLDAFGAYVFSFGVFNLIMAFLSFRVNLAFVIIFVTVFSSTVTLSSAYWRAKYDVDQYQCLVKASGAILFVAAMDGWYLFIDSMLPTVGFKQRLPMGKFAGGFGRFK